MKTFKCAKLGVFVEFYTPTAAELQFAQLKEIMKIKDKNIIFEGCVESNEYHADIIRKLNSDKNTHVKITKL